MDSVEPYKSLRTVIYEVQTAVKPTKLADKKLSASPQDGHKPGETWKTASGKIGAKNKDGVVDYFEDEDSAKAWISGKYAPAGRVKEPGDTSTPVELDADGYEAKGTPKGAPQSGKTAPAAQPRQQAAPQPQAAPAKAERSPQPKDSGASAAQPDAEEHPEVGAENPQTEFDKHITVDPKATEKAKSKPDIRKANVLAKAVKAGDLDGPQSDAESVFGDAEAERRFVEEINHAALSAMRGQQAYDFELCSEVFAHLGLCFDPKTKEKVSKGIPRDQMPQFSSQVDPNRTDTPAFTALMRGKGYTSPDQVTPEDLKTEVNMEREYRKALEAAGYEVVDEEVSVTSLKPIQGQLKGEKIAGMYGTLAAAQADPQNYGKGAARLLEPIYVSDGYVIDGHHRWAAQVAIDIANGAGANATMKTRTITKKGKSVPVDEIINFSNKFQKDIGLLSQTRGGETIPEKKKSTQKEGYQMRKFGGNRLNRVIESLCESAHSRLGESRKNFFKPPIQKDEPKDSQRFATAMRPLKTRKTDKFGNIIKSGSSRTARDTQKQLNDTIAKNQTTARDLIHTIEMKPVGTTFEIYGKKNGKEDMIKVKKVMKTGDAVLVVGNTEVELYAAGSGLQVLNKKTRKAFLDAGDDIIWESADFTDVGRIYISEVKKLSDTELEKADDQRRKRVIAAKEAAIKRRAAEGKAAWKPFSKPWKE
jgi:hypothetical protein